MAVGGKVGGLMNEAVALPGWSEFGALVAHFRLVKHQQRHIEKGRRGDRKSAPRNSTFQRTPFKRKSGTSLLVNGSVFTFTGSHRLPPAIHPRRATGAARSRSLRA